jgi:hypothetical protein
MDKGEAARLKLRCEPQKAPWSLAIKFVVVAKVLQSEKYSMDILDTIDIRPLKNAEIRTASIGQIAQ